MPFPLHKSPVGLLELMRLRTLGQNPTTFAEGVVPTIDVREFYGADLLQTIVTPNSTGAIVPELEAAATFAQPFGVRAISGVFTCGAGAATNVSLTVDLQLFVPALAAFVGVSMAAFSYPAVAAGQLIRFGAPCNFVVPAGARIAAYVSGTAAGVDHVIHARACVENYLVP